MCWKGRGIELARSIFLIFNATIFSLPLYLSPSLSLPLFLFSPHSTSLSLSIHSPSLYSSHSLFVFYSCRFYPSLPFSLSPPSSLSLSPLHSLPPSIYTPLTLSLSLPLFLSSSLSLHPHSLSLPPLYVFLSLPLTLTHSLSTQGNQVILSFFMFTYSLSLIVLNMLIHSYFIEFITLLFTY
jgi:hypothetical protein